MVASIEDIVRRQVSNFIDGNEYLDLGTILYSEVNDGVRWVKIEGDTIFFRTFQSTCRVTFEWDHGHEPYNME